MTTRICSYPSARRQDISVSSMTGATTTVTSRGGRNWWRDLMPQTDTSRPVTHRRQRYGVAGFRHRICGTLFEDTQEAVSLCSAVGAQRHRRARGAPQRSRHDTQLRVTAELYLRQYPDGIGQYALQRQLHLPRQQQGTDHSCRQSSTGRTSSPPTMTAMRSLQPL